MKFLRKFYKPWIPNGSYRSAKKLKIGVGTWKGKLAMPATQKPVTGFLEDDEMSDRYYDSERLSTLMHGVRSSPLKYSGSFSKKVDRTPTEKFAAPTDEFGLVPKHQTYFDKTACKNSGPDPYNITCVARPPACRASLAATHRPMRPPPTRPGFTVQQEEYLDTRRIVHCEDGDP